MKLDGYENPEPKPKPEPGPKPFAPLLWSINGPRPAWSLFLCNEFK